MDLVHDQLSVRLALAVAEWDGVHVDVDVTVRVGDALRVTEEALGEGEAEGVPLNEAVGTTVREGLWDAVRLWVVVCVTVAVTEVVGEPDRVSGEEAVGVGLLVGVGVGLKDSDGEGLGVVVEAGPDVAVM